MGAPKVSRDDASAAEGRVAAACSGEFGPLWALFEMRVFTLDHLGGAEFEAAKRPGVYVFWHPSFGFIKVGKSQSNAPRRAMQHCGLDNTTSNDRRVQMANLKDDPRARLFTLTLKDPSRMHWVLALEHFLEIALDPKIRSRRSG